MHSVCLRWPCECMGGRLLMLVRIGKFDVCMGWNRDVPLNTVSLLLKTILLSQTVLQRFAKRYKKEK